jgi:glycine cleavage system aminomethyltransferase T
MIHRWVYKVLLDADGNFKADHVRQKSNDDIWLMNGAGMFPNKEEYFTFLAQAIERNTVGHLPSDADHGVDADAEAKAKAKAKVEAEADQMLITSFVEGTLRKYIQGHSKCPFGFQVL